MCIACLRTVHTNMQRTHSNVYIRQLHSITRSALLAPALYAVVVADASAPACLTLKSAAYMLAYRRSATLLELALFALVGADA